MRMPSKTDSGHHSDNRLDGKSQHQRALLTTGTASEHKNTRGCGVRQPIVLPTQGQAQEDLDDPMHAEEGVERRDGG